MPIDLSLPPWGVKGDWSDNGSAIQEAADFYGIGNGVQPDNGGSIGETLMLPAGSIVSGPITLPYGVALQGVADYGSSLIANSSVTGEIDFVRGGDPNSPYSTFGGALRHMKIHCSKTAEASPSVAAVRMTSVQDGLILDHVRIYGHKRRWLVCEKGQGGASIISLRQVTGNTDVAGLPGCTFDYGEGTMIEVDGLEPSGARVDPSDENSPPIAGTIGVLMKGGFAEFKRFHPELLESGMIINLTPRPNSNYTASFCDVDFAQGSDTVRDLFVVSNNQAQAGRIRLANVARNGLTRHTVYNGQSGANPIDTDIIDPVRL
jgi:hypothetical protein